MKKHEVIIIGGGPGGSSAATFFAMNGIDAAVIEREIYPRFHIGESLLPFSMDIFKETGFFEVLNSGKYMRKYGAQFIHYEEEGEVYFNFENGLDNDHALAFEVPRAEFDKDLLDYAKKRGATVYQPELVKNVEFFESHVQITTDKEIYEAQFVVDASGRNSFIGKRQKLRHSHPDLNNIAVFAHYTGVMRNEGKRQGDITIGLLQNAGWSWMIPFLGERTSVGIVCSSKAVKDETDTDRFIENALACSPFLQERMSKAERVTDTSIISNYSHRCETLVESRWILVGDAAIFLDPIFSTGVHVALSTGKFSANLITRALREKMTLDQGGIKEDYEELVHRGVDRFYSLVRLFYNTNFVRQMKKAFDLKMTRKAFTSAVAGDVWNDENFIFKKGAIS